MNVNLNSSIPVAHADDKKNNAGDWGFGVIVGAVMIPVDGAVQIKYLVQWENKEHPALHDHFASELINLTDFAATAEDFFGEGLDDGDDNEDDGVEVVVPIDSHVGGAQLSADDLDGLEEEYVDGGEEYVDGGEEYVDTKEVEVSAIDMTTHDAGRRASQTTM